MTRYPTVLMVTMTSDGTNRLRTEKIKVPAGISLTTAANPSDPYRQDGYPAFPDTPPYAIQSNTRDEALRTAHDFFERLRGYTHGKGIQKHAYDDRYLQWVNNMTTLSVARDEVDEAIPRTAERLQKHSDTRVYPHIHLQSPKWIVYIGSLQWEAHR